MAGRVEGHHTLRAIAQQGIDVGRRRLGGCLLRSLHVRLPAIQSITRSASIGGGRLGDLGRRRPQGGEHQSRPHGESTLRAEPDRHLAHRLGAHRPLQLPLRPPQRRQLRRAHRGHRRGALRGALRARHPRRPRLAGSRLGRGPRRGGPYGPYRQANASRRTARQPTGCSPPVWPIAASAARSASTRCASRRWPTAARRATTAPAGGSTRRGRRAPRRRRTGRPALRRAQRRGGLRRRHPRPHRDRFREDIGDFIILRSDGMPELQLRGRGRRRRDGHHARHPRRRPPHQHGPAGAAAPRPVPRRAGARLRPPRHDPGGRRRQAVQAPRGDVGGRLPRARLSAAGDRQLSGPAVVVARRRRGARHRAARRDLRSGRAVEPARRSSTWPSSTG